MTDDPAMPSPYQPGSPEKQAVLAARAALGLPLHLPGDVRLPLGWEITYDPAAVRVPHAYRAHADEPVE